MNGLNDEDAEMLERAGTALAILFGVTVLVMLVTWALE